MKIEVKPGIYVVAVSGGVDSMALLDLLSKQPGHKLIVAHFDHGIREDSLADRKLVQDVTRRHGHPFVYDEGKMGFGTSEESARKARYDFLHSVRKSSGAHAVITAHHQDDLLETAVHNLLRGTGRKGLVSLRSRKNLHRPLLDIPKSDLIAYAKDQGLVWREDSTNADLRFRRNYIRHKILPKFSHEQKQELLQHIRKMRNLDADIDNELVNHLHLHPNFSELDRHWFIMLPHSVAKEILAEWLRRHRIKDISNKMLERLVTAAKTYRPGKITDVDDKYIFEISKQTLKLVKKVQI